MDDKQLIHNWGGGWAWLHCTMKQTSISVAEGSSVYIPTLHFSDYSVEEINALILAAVKAWFFRSPWPVACNLLYLALLLMSHEIAGETRDSTFHLANCSVHLPLSCVHLGWLA